MGLAANYKPEITADLKKIYERHSREAQNPAAKKVAFILNLPWTLCGLLLALISFPTGAKIEEGVLIIRVRKIWLSEIFARRRILGTTAGSVILLRSDQAEKSTYLHELVHVKQFERNPFFFPILYFVDLIKHGYWNNEYEKEAYWLSNAKT